MAFHQMGGDARGALLCELLQLAQTLSPTSFQKHTNIMKRFLTVLAVVLSIVSAQAEPLRVFIRGGKKSHGPEQHEHQRFLEKWTPLLTERGMKVDEIGRASCRERVCYPV